MSDNVVKLELREVGEGFRIDPDQILEAAKGHGFARLVIVGEPADGGELYVASSDGAAESFLLLHKATANFV